MTFSLYPTSGDVNIGVLLASIMLCRPFFLWWLILGHLLEEFKNRHKMLEEQKNKQAPSRFTKSMVLPNLISFLSSPS